MSTIDELLLPGQIGTVRVKNRLVMSPMLVGFATMDGRVSDTLLDYYEARARGGVGLIIVEAACIDSPEGKEGLGQLEMNTPDCIEGLEKLAQRINKHDCRAFIQLFHAGRQTSQRITGVQPVAPSAIACSAMRELPRSLSLEQIKQLEQQFVKAASYAYRAGFDGIEIHAAHGYLINQFLSAHTNQRRDLYGGSLENRIRLLLDIVTGVKQDMPELAVSVRLNIDDFVPGGLQPDESIEISLRLEQAGTDVIHCSCGTYESGLTSIEPASYQEGWRVPLAEQVKKHLHIPVIAGGMISNPAFANQVIKENRADFIFLGRSLMADPDWLVKASQGKSQEIRPCIRCNNCISSHFIGSPVSCTVNPAVGREGQYGVVKPLQAETKRKVHIVGAGPAGMQAGITLDSMGFEVSIFDKEDKAGGLMNLAGLPPHKGRILELRDYMLGQLKAAGVEMVYNYPYGMEQMRLLRPDIMIVATGSVPMLPDIEGAVNSINIEQVFKGEVVPRESRIVVIGGGSNGCEVADYLLQYGNHITILEKSPYLAADMEKKNRRVLLNHLRDSQVVSHSKCRVNRILPGMVEFIDADGEEHQLAADYIIMAVGYSSRNELYLQARQEHAHIFIAGDAFRVRGFKSAILEGEMVARMIYREATGLPSARWKTE